MRKKIICIIVLLSTVTATMSQTALPSFTPAEVKIYIPAYLPGIMDDSAFLQNDTLVYTLTGQLFDKGYKIPLNTPPGALTSPWETVAEMVDAYSKKNTKRIIALYASNSKAQITKVLTGVQGVRFLDFVSKASKANIRILGGIQYKNGFMAYLKDDLYGVHNNFIIKENGKYKLSALNDKAPTSWNIALYFKYEPKPMIPLGNIVIPDSLPLNAVSAINVTLPEPGRWMSVYLDKPGGPVLMFVQDNGINDKNPAQSKITIPFPGSLFVNAGTYTFYVSSFNFPVQKVARSIVVPEAMHTIKIY